jgi:hypothetical protein
VHCMADHFQFPECETVGGTLLDLHGDFHIKSGHKIVEPLAFMIVLHG